MRVRSRRMVAVAVERRSHSSGLPKHDVRLFYALADSDGRVVQEGRLPAHVAADTLVVADFGLIDHPETQRLRTSRVGLVTPRSPASRPWVSNPSDAAAVLREWRDEPQQARAVVDDSELGSLRRYLEARSGLTRLRDQLLEQIVATLGAASREYLEIISEDGRLLSETVALLREYPTPRTLDDKGVIMLTRAIERAASNPQPAIDRLMRLVEQPERLRNTLDSELAEVLLPGNVERYLIIPRQLYTLDLRIHHAARFGVAPAGGGASDGGSAQIRGEGATTFSLYANHLFSIARQPLSPVVDLDQSLRTVHEIYERRSSPERSPRADYELYRATRAPLDAETLSAEDAVRLETIGQLLALATGDFLDAIRFRTACDRLLSEALEAGDLSERVHADAALSLAITEVCAVDFVSGFASLRGVVESELAAKGTPELVTEAIGLMSLVIVLFGEYLSYPEVLQIARASIDAHGGCGASRAAADIAELFLIAGKPGTDSEALEAAHDQAERSSRDTVYRSFYHYIMMLSTYITKDIERGLHHYTMIKQQGLWSRFNRRFDRLARLAYAIHLAGRGEFATARRQLSISDISYTSISDGADFLIRGLFQLRLDLAVGRHQQVLAETMPDGPFGELQIQSVHLRRYAPVSLVLRGSSLIREGERELAIDCFTRATQQSAMSGEWMALLAAETLEYREWLESLDPSRPEELPAGLTPRLREAILARPLLVQHTLDPLTPQQTRILRLLAQDRAAASIAAELHISANTLKTHLRQLYQRLGVRSREQAVLHAEIYGLL